MLQTKPLFAELEQHARRGQMTFDLQEQAMKGKFDITIMQAGRPIFTNERTKDLDLQDVLNFKDVFHKANQGLPLGAQVEDLPA